MTPKIDNMKTKMTLLALGLYLLGSIGCGTADDPIREIDGVDITTGTIRGNVEQIEGVTYQVRLFQDGQLIVQTEAKSIFFLKEIEAGDYIIVISAPGYEKSEQNVTVLVDETVALDMVALVELGHPVSNITGQLSNARTGVKLPQVRVILTDNDGEQYETLTVDEGIFTFENLPVDQQYTVTIELEGYEDKEIKVETDSTEETVKLYVRITPQGVEEEIEPLIPGKGLDILSEAPDFELPDGNNKLHTLNDFIQDGKKVVLVFYRGGL